jgi:zinc transport system substrate-binding protein
MKRILAKLFSLIILIGMFACTNEERQPIEDLTLDTSDTISVSATLYPLYDIARQIGGTKVEVQLILPPGESPHTFSPTIRDKRVLDNSEKIFIIGHLLDDWVVSSVTDPSKIVIVDTNISLLPSSQSGDSEHQHGESDPHYWLDPRNAALISRTIANEYSVIDSENTEYYQEQAALFSKSVTKHFTELLVASESIQEKPFFTVHSSWSYFSEAFNLRHAGTFEPASGENPGPRYLKNMQDSIRKEGVTVIFSEPQLSTTSINAFAQENNLDIAILDPIGGMAQTESYQELISFNIKTLIEYLDE